MQFSHVCEWSPGALEALIDFLRNQCKPPVPVARVGIGSIYKRDVMQTSIMIEKGRQLDDNGGPRVSI